ncbi:polysaccharide export protein [Roseomonas sp. NAR14]|uniref:Polysaccharide export protein n=1 Tax=Roseomonas acroporae TaxID=2937791 RepID=A0A9X1Y7K6_9PROT|nr:polysaccharide biosynthesis/export family protein [Roseomonas acroporae]MCK8784598.1 polysaccharide export protein [Roseomonas acroporae]
MPVNGNRGRGRLRTEGGLALLLLAATGLSAGLPPLLLPLAASAQTLGTPAPLDLPLQSLQPQQGGAAGTRVQDLLTPQRPVARPGEATESEGGAIAAGPLGDRDRQGGPATAVFGASLFTGQPTTTSDAPNPSYILAPGDRVSVRVWGGVEAETVAVVDPDGNLFLPQIGPIRLAGARAGDLQRIVENEVRRIYTSQVQVYAVLLSTHRIGVYVTGFVRRPGRYGGAASDSVLDFLVRSGGVDPGRGSFRDITVQRNGRAVTTIDLYGFLLNGRLPPISLQEGDTILVNRQRAMVGADGAVRNNFLFEVSGRGQVGRELLDLARPLPAATNAIVRGTRGGAPYSRYATLTELASVALQDQDTVTFITDAPAQTVRVMVEGSRIGPSVLVADRDIRLCQLLDHIAVDPGLADTRSVFLLRPRLAEQQRRSINEALDRLERQLFLAVSATTGVAEIRASEAQLVASYIQRGRRTRPDGRLVVTDRQGRCADIRMEEGDTVVIPELSSTVLVAGEVATPQAVVWRPNMSISDYINAVGGYSSRGTASQLMIRHANGEIELDPRNPPRAGDELIALPRLDPKVFQITRDVLGLFAQVASSAATALYLTR